MWKPNVYMSFSMLMQSQPAWYTHTVSDVKPAVIHLAAAGLSCFTVPHRKLLTQLNPFTDGNASPLYDMHHTFTQRKNFRLPVTGSVFDASNYTSALGLLFCFSALLAGRTSPIADSTNSIPSTQASLGNAAFILEALGSTPQWGGSLNHHHPPHKHSLRDVPQGDGSLPTCDMNSPCPKLRSQQVQERPMGGRGPHGL